MSKGTKSSDAPFGTLLGYAPGGVAIYSSNYSSLGSDFSHDDPSFRSYIGNEYMGHKWQCVEFARRFLFLTYGFVFTDVGMAYEIFSLRFLREVVNDNLLPLKAFANGCRRPPVAGSLLIWQKGGEFHETGHVAVVTQLLGNKVRVAEQNVLHHPLPPGQQWTRELTLTVQDGHYTIHDTFDDTHILGWMIQTDDAQYSEPQPEVPGELLAIHGARLADKGQFDGKWLNERDPLQMAYVRANGHVINKDPYQYFTISETAEQELIKATNELHLMYLHATDKVMKDDNLLALFDIPKILWPRLRLSWQRRRHHMITGRMDFCMDERGLKVYEYNADSASCHTEGGLILEQWAEQGYSGKGHNPAEDLLDELAGAWQHSRARPFVHIMQDNDLEESYHAQFIQRSLTQAGFESKILCGLAELRWDDAGQLIDGDGRLVNCVWKTWAWETAIEQVREVSETEYAAVPIRTGHPYQDVRLIDVLLRPEVLVFEPLWTVIPGNKAILPVLWSLFPGHRYLLDTDFVVNEELAKTGYAVKPISGRCGSNIDLVSHDEQLLDQSSGNFADRKSIYQQLWCLPKVDGKYIQVCTFTVGGSYGGTCLRGDDSLVVKKESDIEPLIVVKDKDFL
ncbi:MAG: bifunctional glutathionylspermidine amidase/synthase [Yokenella regensburgei]|jgi:glutathionylspermidine amidase/synthetase|uniref:Bifunctional glutathionylspermidine synthetase/amidase n=1 Tax=Yokenella regensburgei TaxID=158877 RepID=A0AB38G122_9ENTR|nr:bifunctional glutathionylspermidine amidase/synthase [Yokenella regensburgei]EHM49255.1 glutathionylspermidine synthetase/amidase [Yokenella regensburgei ATCC 43003]KAF1369973.1 glutathionylspermidine amidase/synthetase [Yokenella regensburgei]KFD23072.1 glutathionylspermidine synthase/glutathionylspermidine amidohydrolase [Yokenella regensburgei ATCC 49455]MDQ4430590.1 bifunctional glutathionylspermidine amidase/synthase [Yokenella regensburgei]MDR2217030.1 bifunctional glutathionylspermid